MGSTRRAPPFHLSLPSTSFGEDSTFTPSPLSSPFILLPDALPSAYHASNAFSTPPSTPPCGSNWNAASLFGTRRQLRRNSSLSSLASEEEEMEEEWTGEEEEKLRRTFDTYVARASATETPFANGAPPSNLLHVIARAVISNSSSRVLRSSARRGSTSSGEVTDEDVLAPKWRHGIKSTRVKILALIKERQHEATIDETPRQGDSDATPRRRNPMVRQGSMDFLPTSRNVAVLARLGSKLHRAEQGGPPPTSHPYAYPTRGRLNRTASLASIAGSPSQPATPTPISNHTSALSSIVTGASTRMGRTNSDVTGNRFIESTRMGRANSDGGKRLRLQLDNSDRSPSLPPSDSLTLPSLSTSNSSSTSLFSLAFDSTPHKPTGSGLGSAFHTPSLGVYPSPVSNSKHRLEASELEHRLVGLGGAFEEYTGSHTTEDGLRSGEGGRFYFGGGGAGGQRGGQGRDEEIRYHSSSCDSLSSSYGSDHSLSSTLSSSFGSDSSLSSIHHPAIPTATTTRTTLQRSHPASSNLDMNELSLDAQLLPVDVTRKSGEKTAVDEGAGDYISAGMEARRMRESMSGWAGWEQN